MRWCYLCSTEFPEGTPMKMDRGGSNLCLPCAETPRGKAQLPDQVFNSHLKGYRPRQTSETRFQSAVKHWMRRSRG